MNNHILSLLGLALRGGRLAVGEEPVALAARAGQARLLLLASDAAGNTLRRAEHLAAQGHCLWLVLPFSKAELGGALGRGSAAITALTDTGLAAAVTQRLAALDPERYGQAAERMELKRRRAKERQAAPHRAPPPPERREDRRPRNPRRESGASPRRDGHGPHGRDGRPWSPNERQAGGDRPQGGRPGGKPENGRPRGGPPGKGRPYGGKSGGGRPGKSGTGRSGKRPGYGPGHPPGNKGGSNRGEGH